MPKARVKMRIESGAVARLAAKLAGLDRKAARKALKAGVNEITKQVMWDAKALVPKRTGLLRKSLGRKVVTYRGGGIVVGVIGPRKGFRTLLNGEPIDPRKYAHLVEYGRREVRPKKKKVLVGSGVPVAGKMATQMGPWQRVVYGKKVRSVPPRPFLRPAWEKNAARAVEILVRALRTAFRDVLRGQRAKLLGGGKRR